MEMTLLPDRLIKIREARGLNKAEASRLLGLSKMGYLRDSDPELFDIIIDIADKKSEARDRLLAYYREINK